MVYREGHSALYVGNHEVIVYGGCASDMFRDEQYHDCELMIYNTLEHTWAPGMQLEDRNLPLMNARSRHAVCLSNDRKGMFVSGGVPNSTLEPYDELYHYAIASGKWTGPYKFVRRFDHRIAHQGDKIWAFGGMNNDMAHTLELTWFDLVSGTTGITKLQGPRSDDMNHEFLQTGNPDLVLDVVVPTWTYAGVQPSVGLFDLRNMRYNLVIAPNFKPLLGYMWRVNFIVGDQLYLMGYPLSSRTMDITRDYELSRMLSVDFSALCPKEEDRGGLSIDFAKLLNEDKLSDFTVYAVNSAERPSLDTPFEQMPRSEPIPVHKLILYARWPYFRMIENSGMAESKSGTLFIPEPVAWVRALVEYLYTNEVSDLTVDNTTGLLILSNVYRLPELRERCLSWIQSCALTAEIAVTLWRRSKTAQEPVLEHNAATYCLQNWGKCVQAEHFMDLSKDELIALCQQAPVTSAVTLLNKDVHRTKNMARNRVRGPAYDTEWPDDEDRGGTNNSMWW